MILADTSAWVEYDRATGSAVHRRMRRLIVEEQPLATMQPVVMEVVAGARDAKRDLRRLLSRFALLSFDATTDFDGAVRVYRECRARGVTPRGLVDRMIVAVAARHGAPSWRTTRTEERHRGEEPFVARPPDRAHELPAERRTVIVGGPETRDIVIVDPDPIWPQRYTEVERRVRGALDGRAGLLCEPLPQATHAPAGLVGQVADADVAVACVGPSPRQGDLPVWRGAPGDAGGQEGIEPREPLWPRSADRGRSDLTRRWSA